MIVCVCMCGRGERSTDHHPLRMRQSVVDTQHSFVGLESIAGAIDHMYKGSNVGKVVVALRPPSLSAPSSSNASASTAAASPISSKL